MVGMLHTSRSGDFGWFSELDTTELSISKSTTSTHSSTIDESLNSDYGDEDIEEGDASPLSFKQNMMNDNAIGSSIQEGLVLFTFDNVISTLSCRSFQSLVDHHDNTQIWISVQSFRIIQYSDGVRVEFKLVMIINDKKFSCWKRYSDFTKLAKSCGISVGMFRFMNVSPRYLRKSALTWNDLETRKPWFRMTSIKYLIWKTCKLEDFLRNLLFEIHTPQILVDFMGGESV
jgi:hypothetical protein